MISKSFEKEMKSLFGEDIVNLSREFNKIGRFTEEQVETIESTCREMLDKANDKSSQQQFIEELDWHRSCLLCAWVLRGGRNLINC